MVTTINHTDIDPFTLEIEGFSGGYYDVLCTTAYQQSTIIYEVLDYVGLTDSKASLSPGNGVTAFWAHWTSVKDVIENLLRKMTCIPRISIANDHMVGGTHLSDVCLAMPIFYDGI